MGHNVSRRPKEKVEVKEEKKQLLEDIQLRELFEHKI
jgi:hypothetical protein